MIWISDVTQTEFYNADLVSELYIKQTEERYEVRGVSTNGKIFIVGYSKTVVEARRLIVNLFAPQRSSLVKPS